jgi:RND family efflux transporter MFP subunit
MLTPRVASLALVLALTAACNKQAPVEAKQDRSGPIGVTTAKVTTRQVQRSVEGIGSLFPYDEAIISAEIDGRVDQVNVDLGDIVKEGQIMVRISDEEQRYILAQNEAQLRSAMERLGMSRENERIADIKNTPDMRRAQADLFEAEQRYKRTRELRDQGIGSQQDLDQAQARFQSAQATLDATGNMTRNLISEVERFRAVVELQRKKLRDTNVRAPFTASVKERQVTVGQFVRTNSPLLTLVKTDPLRLRLEIPERMAPWVRTGQEVQVTIEAFTDRNFNGKIWRISPTIDPQKRTFVAEALIPNSAGLLKPGGYARAIVPTEKVERVVLAPAKAVSYVLGANKSYVVADGAISARDIKIGDRFNQDVEILEGLEPGEVVATSQLVRLDDGVQVRIETSNDKKAVIPNPSE